MKQLGLFKQFVPKVLDGSKPHSFRMKRKCEPGDMLELYTGERPSKRKVIAVVRCTHVVECTIGRHVVAVGPYIFSLAQSEVLFRPFKMWPTTLPTGIRCLPLEHFARAEGFYNHAEMIDFFYSIYPPGLTLSGFLHVWEPIPKPAPRQLAKSKTSEAGRAAIKKRKIK